MIDFLNQPVSIWYMLAAIAFGPTIGTWLALRRVGKR